MTASRPWALRAGVVAVVVLLPFGDTSVPVLGMRLVHVAMLVPAALALHQVVVRGARIPGSVVLIGCGLGLVSGVVSGADGVDPSRSVPLVVGSAITTCYALAVALAHRPGEDLAGLELLVIVGGVTAASALVSVGRLQAAEAGNVVNGRLTGPFSQPNELGIFCAALLPVALACVVTSSSWRRAALLSAATASLAVACVLSMSRGAWIGALASFVCLAACEPALRRALLAIGLAAAAICGAALVAPVGVPVLGVVGARIRTLGDPTQNQYDDRPLVWAEAWRQAADHPWLGVGPGGFRSAATDSVSAVAAQPPEHPHNLLLTVLADRGVVGAALGIVVVAGCVLAVRRHVLSPQQADPAVRVLRIRSIAVIAGLAAVAVHGGFDMPLRNPIVSGLVWTLLGLAVVAETVPLTRYAAGHDTTTNRRKWVPVTC
ncbi:O-antigen ligase family protein [Nocardioides carbamazepini]|uniref:O-antigen ligase family protein n=1 Tax=Nocardioides carbamazepini TaxID=2854259 RepID=UPI002149F15A|nr:O-antigen ligase family protein [Nocardioides carbamazepini]MCR1782007.1 O-antigen ligase family protein [Nocardioides carbamazepini]